MIPISSSPFFTILHHSSPFRKMSRFAFCFHFLLATSCAVDPGVVWASWSRSSPALRRSAPRRWCRSRGSAPPTSPLQRWPRGRLRAWSWWREPWMDRCWSCAWILRPGGWGMVWNGMGWWKLLEMTWRMGRTWMNSQNLNEFYTAQKSPAGSKKSLPKNLFRDWFYFNLSTPEAMLWRVAAAIAIRYGRGQGTGCESIRSQKSGCGWFFRQGLILMILHGISIKFMESHSRKDVKSACPKFRWPLDSMGFPEKSWRVVSCVLGVAPGFQWQWPNLATLVGFYQPAVLEYEEKQHQGAFHTKGLDS